MGRKRRSRKPNEEVDLDELLERLDDLYQYFDIPSEDPPMISISTYEGYQTAAADPELRDILFELWDYTNGDY